MKTIKNVKTKIQAATALSTMTLAGGAMAAVPAAVTDALTTAGTDAATLGSAVLVVVVATVVFKYLRRAL